MQSLYSFNTALFSVWTPRKDKFSTSRKKDRMRNEIKQLLSGHAEKDRCFMFLFFSVNQMEVSLVFTWPSSNRYHADSRKVPQTTQERGLVKTLEMGENMDEYVCLTDLCRVWCQLGWQRQQVPDWASAHRAFRTAWSCPHGSGCRCHDQQSNLRGTTHAAQGYDYLQQHDHDLAQYLLKIQLK